MCIDWLEPILERMLRELDAHIQDGDVTDLDRRIHNAIDALFNVVQGPG